MENDKQFGIGDVVRIREWDDMEREYGRLGGNIPCNGTFSSQMFHLCGLEFIIESISEAGRVEGLNTDYVITTDMIELIQEEELSDDTSDIDNYLALFTKR